MSKIIISGTVASIFLVGIAASASVHAATLYVGACGSPHQTTIQAAVNAIPAGGTIIVCPGVYPEQVTITKNLTVSGLAVGNVDSAVITSPAAGVVVNTSDLYQPPSYPVAAQVLVQNATVTLSNITVDGTGNAVTTCATDLRGIYYQNASGVIANVAVRNQVLPAGYTGCQSGQGIFVQSGYGTTTTHRSVSVLGSSVHNFQKNGITGDGNTLTISVQGNYIVGQGPTNGAAENGIQISDGTQGQVQGNTTLDEIWAPDTASDTGDAASGILIYSSQHIQVVGNTVGSTQFGIVTVSDPAYGLGDYTTIAGNQILGTQIFDGIDVCSNNNTVSDNVVFSSTEAGIHLDSSCTASGKNNYVAGNTINEACAAILEGVSGNTIGANGYANVNSKVLAGNTCSATAPTAATVSAGIKLSTAAVTARAAQHFSPAR